MVSYVSWRPEQMFTSEKMQPAILSLCCGGGDNVSAAKLS